MTGRFDVADDLGDHFYVEVPRTGAVGIGENFGAPRWTETDLCRLPLDVWRQIRQPVEREFRRQMRDGSWPGATDGGRTLDGARFAVGRNRLSHRLGIQVLVLSRAVEAGGDVETAVRRRLNLAAFERPWLYRQVVEQGHGLADSERVGWRRALQAALCNESGGERRTGQADLFSGAAA